MSQKKREKVTIQRIIDKLKEKNGTLLLQGPYTNNNTTFSVKCEFGHIWNISWNISWSNLSQGKWCPYCVGHAKLTIQDAQKLALQYKGTVVSSTISGNKEKLEWKCVNDHIFKASYNAVKRENKWCPHCSIRWKSEEICRIYFETIFDNKFQKYRVDWLQNRVGKKLELDGYCEELGLAFEHHGQQHFQEGWFNGSKLSKQKFETTTNNDYDKMQVCIANGIKLIVIPQIHLYTSIKKLEELIKSLAIEYNIQLKESYTFDLSSLTKSESDRKRMEKFAKVVSDKGGKCLEHEYLSSITKMKIECARGHIWKASYDKIVGEGTWCFDCRVLNQVKIIDISKETLLDLYVNQKLAIGTISKKYGTINKKIFVLFKKYDIEHVLRHRPFDTSCEVLRELYSEYNGSILKMGKVLKRDYKCIKTRLRKFGIIP